VLEFSCEHGRSTRPHGADIQGHLPSNGDHFSSWSLSHSCSHRASAGTGGPQAGKAGAFFKVALGMSPGVKGHLCPRQRD
jgi:hypothetical protein